MSTFLSWVAGASTPNNSGRSIDLFLTQLESMPKLLDKRQSAADLFDAIKDAPDAVPSSVIPRLIYILGSGVDDEDILQKVLDILCFLTELKQVPSSETLLIENISTLLCEESYLEILLGLFDSPDVWVRIEAIQILKNCIAVNQSIVEKSILGCSMGLQKLVDVLNDSREEVRNEMLLLLRSLTRRNQEICKFIAFQDGYDILIRILESENGVVARDCLHIIYNMVANSVLTLKLFSQKKLISAIINVLSVSEKVTPASSIHPSPINDSDTSFAVHEPMGDRVIDLTRYGDLECVSNVEVQCYQFAVSILELAMEEDSYRDDDERLQIALPVIKANRTILHSNPEYLFNMLYFTLYQLRQDIEMPDMDNEQRRHNIDDLMDLSTRCEPLLALSLQKSPDFNLLKELLRVNILDSSGCHDLISLLLDGFLDSELSSVVNEGLYENSSIYVRLFMLLFTGDVGLRSYLIQPESGCGDILKSAFMKALEILIIHKTDDEEYRAAVNHMKLISSVYLQCCEENSSGFMELFVGDEECQFLDELKQIATDTIEGEATAEQMHDEKKDPSENNVEDKFEESTEEKYNEGVEDQMEVAEGHEEIVEGHEEIVEDHEEDIEGHEESMEGATEVNHESPSEATHSDLNTPSTPCNAPVGRRLWCVLCSVLTEDCLPLDWTTHLTRLLLSALLHDSHGADSAFDSLPMIMRCIDCVTSSQKTNCHQSSSFDVQLLFYLRLFLLLALLQPLSHCREYIQLLQQRLGLESICNLSIRFFYLSHIRSVVFSHKENAMDEIGLDMPMIDLMESVYHRFKDTLFSFFIGITPAIDDDSQMVINSYKELIRVQDQDLRTIKLATSSGQGAGIELVEEYEVKTRELEASGKRIQDLEQEVYDWKQRFSAKEEALREKDQSYEQLEYMSQNEKEALEKEKISLEEQIRFLSEEKNMLDAAAEQSKEKHEQEMSAMMVSLEKKENQIRLLDTTVTNYDNVIQELRQELQRNKAEYNETYSSLEQQTSKTKKELSDCQASLQQCEKKYNQLKRDYNAVEDELEESKKALMEISSQREFIASAKGLQEENERLKSELERSKKLCNDLQTMVMELQEAKRLMEDMVRSSLSPATPSDSVPATPPIQAAAEKESVPTAEEVFAGVPPE